MEYRRFQQDRKACLEGLDMAHIDKPIVELIKRFSLLPQCFTLQCCYGHFIYKPDQETDNLDRLPDQHEGQVRYRIAYIAICLENSRRGWGLREALETVPNFAPDYVQFGSADWFWERHSNSYVLQVEPKRHMHMDQCVIDFQEALTIELIRDQFFTKLGEVVERSL